MTERDPHNRDDAEFEALLERALRIEVPEPGAVEAPARRPRWSLLAVAASVVVVVGVIVGQLDDAAFFPSSDLSGDVIAHVHHEPMAIESVPGVQPQAVPNVEFQEVLQAAGVRMEPVEPVVRYAKLCPFRGRMVAHFVVQGPDGPVTVLLLPDEDVPSAIPVAEDGFEGTIVPLEQGGSIAVVGESGTAVEEIQREVAAAVQWRL